MWIDELIGGKNNKNLLLAKYQHLKIILDSTSKKQAENEWLCVIHEIMLVLIVFCLETSGNTTGSTHDTDLNQGQRSRAKECRMIWRHRFRQYFYHFVNIWVFWWLFRYVTVLVVLIWREDSVRCNKMVKNGQIWTQRTF